MRRKNKAKYFVNPGFILTIIARYAPKPTKSKELFNYKESHNPIPEIVPISGPKARSIYTYVPPDEGIAVANSDFDSAAGNIQTAANK